MGIYKEGYRQYTGPLKPARSRFLVVAGEEWLRMIRGKWTRRLLYLASVPLVVMVAVALFKGVLQKAGNVNLPLNPVRTLMGLESTIMALLAAAAGAGIIAQDRRSRSLVLYLSRPLNPARYVVGKGLSLWGILSLSYWIPALLLVLIHALVNPVLTLPDTLHAMVALVVGGSLQVAVVTVVLMALSSLGTRSGYIGLAWVAVFFFSDVIAHAMRRATDNAMWADWFSLPRLLKDTTVWSLEPSLREIGAPLVLLGLGGLAGGFLVWRLRSMMKTAVSA